MTPHPDEELGAYPVELVDRIDQEVLHWLDVAKLKWETVDTDNLSRSRALAPRRRVWTGLLELCLQLL